MIRSKLLTAINLKFIRNFSTSNRLYQDSFYTPTSPCRRIMFMSHAEPVDCVFGPNWWKNVIDPETGAYVRKDLNLPTRLEKRQSLDDYQHDPPLTIVGEFQSEWTGYSLKNNNHLPPLDIKHVFSSCSMRSVLTATRFLYGLKNPSLKINIEPGLYEWPHWSQRVQPKWMTDAEYRSSPIGVPVNDYTAMYTREAIRDRIATETFAEYTGRVRDLMAALCKATAEDWGDILVVAHHDSLTVCPRQLMDATGFGVEVAPYVEMVRKVGYCTMVTVVQKSVDAPWMQDHDVLPIFTHLANMEFDVIVANKNAKSL